MTSDELYMRRAFQLAALGRGKVSPNPLVGCVIVFNEQIIGEGWHQQYGTAHAEVNAVNSVIRKEQLQQATVYVNLEPCSHFGKTPPCADMLIRSNVKKVVIANEDSNPLVAGSGIKKLRAAGIEVISGVLNDEGRALNARFFTYMEKGRPYVILKWAQTSDGFISREDYNSKWISNDYSRKLVHQWRTEEDAVMVGTRTAQYDNPQLTARDWPGRNPVRIVSDRSLKLDRTLNLFDQSQLTLCYNTVRDEESSNLICIKLPEQDYWRALLHDLHQRKIQSVIVEGGAQLLSQFIEEHLWDEARVFVSPQMFGNGIKAPDLTGTVQLQQKVMEDQLTITLNNSALR